MVRGGFGGFMDEELKMLELLKDKAVIMVEKQEMYRRAIEVSVAAIKSLESMGINSNTNSHKEPLFNVLDSAAKGLLNEVNSIESKLTTP